GDRLVDVDQRQARAHLVVRGDAVAVEADGVRQAAVATGTRGRALQRRRVDGVLVHLDDDLDLVGVGVTRSDPDAGGDDVLRSALGTETGPRGVARHAVGGGRQLGADDLDPVAVAQPVAEVVVRLGAADVGGDEVVDDGPGPVAVRCRTGGDRLVDDDDTHRDAGLGAVAQVVVRDVGSVGHTARLVAAEVVAPGDHRGTLGPRRQPDDDLDQVGVRAAGREHDIGRDDVLRGALGTETGPGAVGHDTVRGGGGLAGDDLEVALGAHAVGHVVGAGAGAGVAGGDRVGHRPGAVTVGHRPARHRLRDVDRGDGRARLVGLGPARAVGQLGGVVEALLGVRPGCGAVGRVR